MFTSLDLNEAVTAVIVVAAVTALIGVAAVTAVAGRVRRPTNPLCGWLDAHQPGYERSCASCDSCGCCDCCDWPRQQAVN